MKHIRELALQQIKQLILAGKKHPQDLVNKTQQNNLAYFLKNCVNAKEHLFFYFLYFIVKI